MSTQPKYSAIKRSPLAKRLIVYMILFSASITLITTIIQLYNEYQRDINAIESQFDQIENVHLRSFTQSLWATNYQELRIQMEGLVKLPNIIYASVHNGQQLIAETGTIDAKNIIERHYRMRYNFLGRQHVIGQLTVITTLDDIYAELLRDAITIFLSNALRTLLVVIFIYFIFYRLISRHISRISQHFQQLALGKSTSLVLERNPSRKLDELDILVLSANDMQDRINKSHKEFRESEKKYRTLETVSPVGIFYSDKQGKCINANEKCCEIVGMSIEKITGEGWADALHPEDRDRVFAEWEKSAKAGLPFKLEYRFQQGDKVRWVLGQALTQKNDDGEVIGYVGTITDITERKGTERALIESEKKLQLIHSQVPGIVYQFKVDKNGKRSFPYVSPAVEKYIGLSAEAVMDDAEKWFGLIYPDDFSGLEKSTAESLNNLSTWEWEGRFIRKDGEIIWLRGISTPERMADGSTIWNGMFTDVTERVQADETIRRSQKMDALGKLTGGVAHDYNNMLGVILGYSELLKNRLNDEPKLKAYVEKITHAGERGAKLTKKLLAFSKNKSSDTGKFNINTLLQEERHMLEKTLTARIKLEFELENNLWFVCLDDSELEDAILNMSINAMHAIEKHGQLTIATANEELSMADAEKLGLEPGEYVRLSLSDTGSGIVEAMKEKIFDPFYSTKGEKGTGLGLSQVYGFITRCGGAIKVDSMLEQGTRFTLYFPRSQGECCSENQAEAKNTISLKGQETILVVDDEPALLDLSCEILSGQNYQVFRAEGAQQALQIMETEHVDLLISDIIMPEMDGYALAAIVREKYPNIKIQLASGFSGERKTDQVGEELSKNILQKPFSAQTLLKRIRDLLQ